MNVILIALPLVTLLLAVVSQLGGSGVLGRNGFIGLRIPSTMRSDDGWRAGHHAAALPAWIGFAATTVAALAGLAFTDSEIGSLIVSIMVGVIFLIASTWSVIVASVAARSADVEV